MGGVQIIAKDKDGNEIDKLRLVDEPWSYLMTGQISSDVKEMLRRNSGKWFSIEIRVL